MLFAERLTLTWQLDELSQEVIDSELVMHFCEALQQCRVALMDNDELCIAPSDAQSGDTICAFAGAESTCLLRPLDQGHWKLISGDCFVFNNDYEHSSGFPSFDGDVYLENVTGSLERFVIL
jgi:hypothetical protein